MESNISNLKSLTNEELVKFIQKIGYYQTAKIVKENNINGNEILELNQTDIFRWNLNDTEEESLWKCISQLRLNYLTRNNKFSIKKGYIVEDNKYFKYTPRQIRNNCISQSSTHDTILLQNPMYPNSQPETETNNDCEYITLEPPIQKRNNTIIRRIKKYVTLPLKSNSNPTYELLTNESNTYIELSRLSNNNSYQHQETLHYSKKKSKQSKCRTILCCFSCGICNGRVE